MLQKDLNKTQEVKPGIWFVKGLVTPLPSKTRGIERVFNLPQHCRFTWQNVRTSKCTVFILTLLWLLQLDFWPPRHLTELESRLSMLVMSDDSVAQRTHRTVWPNIRGSTERGAWNNTTLKAVLFTALIICYLNQLLSVSLSSNIDIEIIVFPKSLCVVFFYFNLAYVALFVFSLSFPCLLTPYHTTVWDFPACWQASEKHPSPAGNWTSVSIGQWLWLWRLQMGSQWELRDMPSKRPGKTQK